MTLADSMSLSRAPLMKNYGWSTTLVFLQLMSTCHKNRAHGNCFRPIRVCHDYFHKSLASQARANRPPRINQVIGSPTQPQLPPRAHMFTTLKGATKQPNSTAIRLLRGALSTTSNHCCFFEQGTWAALRGDSQLVVEVMARSTLGS